MWFDESIFYQIYPFGFCGAPEQNDGEYVNRIEKIIEWIPHIKKIGANSLYLCPIFESDSHGYDTRDYTVVDRRLGGNTAFAKVCRSCKEQGIRIVLDGVFNHVGRGFWAFQDVLQNRDASKFRDWFIIDFGRNNDFNDGLWYEGWEGHYSLVKLNLYNPQVVEHLFRSIAGWVEEFDIDGLRLDVAYMLPEGFLEQLRSYCDKLKKDFFLVGETIHGDYNRIVNERMLHSCTNYECYKGLHSSFNEMNMFEIGYSLNRQFGAEHWTLYKGKHLMCFADNHDVSRLASILTDKDHIMPLYGLLYGMPGIPCLYYGSEWGIEGSKAKDSDRDLRPNPPKPVYNEIGKWISQLAKVRKENPELSYGDYQQVYQTNSQLVFIREYEGKRVMVVVNASNEICEASLPVEAKTIVDLLTNKQAQYDRKLTIKPKSTGFYRLI